MQSIKHKQKNNQDVKITVILKGVIVLRVNGKSKIKILFAEALKENKNGRIKRD